MRLTRRPGAALAVSSFLIVAATWGITRSKAQNPAAEARPPAAPTDRIEFEVVESFDARYLGDTPGHVGRAGSLRGRPRVGLGDPVFRGQKRVGKVSGLVWDRNRDSLVIEFDPEIFELDENLHPAGPNRVLVGDPVWIRSVDAQQAASPAPR